MTQCRICKAEDLTFKYNVKESTLYKCSSCGYVQVEEQPSEDELNAIYSDSFFDNVKYNDDANQEKENWRRLAFISRYLPPDGLSKQKILDFGCASGDFIQAAKPFYEMWGHDFSPYAIEKARQLNPDIFWHFSSGTHEKLDFPHEFFDAIVTWDVVEHLWDPVSVCERLLRYLKPGGFLFISTPDIGTLTASLTRKYWAFMTPPEHLGFFSKKSISFFLQNKLNCHILEKKNKGKSVNIGFFFYKLKRIFPRLVPGFLPRFFSSKYTRNFNIYVPTADIMYIAAIKQRDIEMVGEEPQIHCLKMPSATKNLFEKRFMDFPKFLVVKRFLLKSTTLGVQPLPKTFDGVKS